MEKDTALHVIETAKLILSSGLEVSHIEALNIALGIDIRRESMAHFNVENKIQKVLAVQDDSFNWYVIPNEMDNEFGEDIENEEFMESGEFDKKYYKYRTGGDLNIIQLYANLEELR